MAAQPLDNRNVSTPPLRVALLRGDDYHNRYLERLLLRHFHVVTVVDEPGIEQRRSIWRRRRWKDAIAAEYHRVRRSASGKNRYRRLYFDPKHDGFTPPNPPPILQVSDINDPRVGASVAQSSAQVCVITCTTRLSAETIRAIGVPIINIHGGHLPDYRGCHCFFTALSEGRFDAIGSTIHFVDVGLDTGDVIEVARPRIDPSDDPERLYSRAERLAAQRLVYWLKEMEEGRAIPRTQQRFRGKLVLRRHRTPAADLAFWWRRRTGQIRLPDLPGGTPDHPWEPPPARSRLKSGPS
jgi:methionyl-tRNA formyltransferase